MIKFFKTIFNWVGFAAGIATLIALYLQWQTKVPKINIINISTDLLTELPNVDELNAVYTYKNDTVKSLWKLHYIISNDGDENIIGEGNNKNILKDNLKFNFHQGYRILDYKINNRDFPFEIKIIRGGFEIKFLQWHPNEKFEIILYVDSIKSSTTPILSSNEREILNGDIIYSNLYKEVKQRESLFDKLPKGIKVIIWWFGVIVYGFFVIIMPLIFISEVYKKIKYRQWVKKEKSLYDEWIHELIKNNKLYNYREPSKLPSYLWNEYPYLKPILPEYEFKTLLLGGLFMIILFLIPLLLLINI